MADLSSVGFSSNENEIDLEGLRNPAPQNERCRTVTIRAGGKIHVLARCVFWAAAASGFCDSA
jgi:hypothetical protein